jgi:DNA-binding transcriptional MerR regulator
MNKNSTQSSTTRPEDRLLIHELAERANASIRTIRYYTEEGLLPPPDMQGKYALYTQAHADRLMLIAQMKDRFLPLREIRALLSTLSDAEVHAQLTADGPASRPAGGPAETASQPAGDSAEVTFAALRGPESEMVQREREEKKRAVRERAERERAASEPGEPSKSAGSAALDYINRLLSEKPGAPVSRPPQAPPGTPPPPTPLPPAARPPTPQAPAPGSPAEPAPGLNSQGETWRRIELVPGLELHVHERFDLSAESRIQQIVYLSRKLFRSTHTK